MTNKELSQDYEHVDHPPYYNTHPSQIEAIDICEVLSFNVGNAFKYVYRRNGKANPVQDLEKAKWYVTREIQRLTAAWKQFVPLSSSPPFANPEISKYHRNLANKIIDTETNIMAKGFYRELLSLVFVENYASFSLLKAIGYLDRLINTYKE